MKNQILKIGKALNKPEQQQIKGGNPNCVIGCYDYCISITPDRTQLSACVSSCIAQNC